MPGSSPAGGPPSGGRPGCAGARSRTPPAGWRATGSSSTRASTGSTITCAPSRRGVMAETPPIGREFTITRVFDAPRELVWKAWTDPEQVARWFGPRGISTPRSTITMDVRPGGTFALTMIGDDDGKEYPSGGTFLEVVEPERLVWRDRDR